MSILELALTRERLSTINLVLATNAAIKRHSENFYLNTPEVLSVSQPLMRRLRHGFNL